MDSPELSRVFPVQWSDFTLVVTILYYFPKRLLCKYFVSSSDLQYCLFGKLCYLLFCRLGISKTTITSSIAGPSRGRLCQATVAIALSPWSPR